MRLWLVQFLIVCVVVSCVFADEPGVRVYTADGYIEGEVVEVSVDGVSVRGSESGDMTRVVAWFDVRMGDEGWVVPVEYKEMWNAAAIGYARRGRGDLRGCGELYASLAEGLVGSDSVMGREVFGGLLDEALVRGDFYDAAVAMVALGSGDGFDSRYRVHEGVALLMGSGEHRLVGLGALIEEGGGSGGLIVRAFGIVDGGDSDGVVGLLEEMEAMGRSDRVSRQKLELYGMMLRAQRHPEAGERVEARDWLRSRGRLKSGGWVDAWCRLGVGASYLNEGDDGEMMSRGVVELVHVMVRFGGERGELARWAMDVAVGVLQEQGRDDEAMELVRSFGLTAIGSE